MDNTLNLPTIKIISQWSFRITWPHHLSTDEMNEVHRKILQATQYYKERFRHEDIRIPFSTNHSYSTVTVRSDNWHTVDHAMAELSEIIRVLVYPMFDANLQAEQVHKALKVCASDPDGDKCKQCPYGCLINCSPAYQEALDYIDKLESDIAAKKHTLNSVYGKDPVLETVADKINYAIQKRWHEELSKMICTDYGVQGAKPVPKKVKTYAIRTFTKYPKEWVGFTVEWTGIDDDIMVERLDDVINWFVWADNFHVYDHQHSHNSENKHTSRIYFQVGDIDTKRYILDNFDAVVKESMKRRCKYE